MPDATTVISVDKLVDALVVSQDRQSKLDAKLEARRPRCSRCSRLMATPA